MATKRTIPKEIKAAMHKGEMAEAIDPKDLPDTPAEGWLIYKTESDGLEYETARIFRLTNGRIVRLDTDTED